MAREPQELEEAKILLDNWFQNLEVQTARWRVLSPKIIYFDSMKNLTHAMKDMNIIDNLKASIFYLDKNFTSCSFRWLRRGLL